MPRRKSNNSEEKPAVERRRSARIATVEKEKPVPKTPSPRKRGQQKPKYTEPNDDSDNMDAADSSNQDTNLNDNEPPVKKVKSDDTNEVISKDGDVSEPTEEKEVKETETCEKVKINDVVPNEQAHQESVVNEKEPESKPSEQSVIENNLPESTEPKVAEPQDKCEENDDNVSATESKASETPLIVADNAQEQQAGDSHVSQDNGIADKPESVTVNGLGEQEKSNVHSTSSISPAKVALLSEQPSEPSSAEPLPAANAEPQT